jgi:hypothetical protein
MHRNDHQTAPNGLHTKGDPATGRPATVVTHDLMNAMQEELAHVVESYLGPLNKADNTQLKKAIDKVISTEVGTAIDGGDFVTRPELGNAAFKNVGTGPSQVAAGSHAHNQYALEDELGNAAYKNVGGAADQVAAGNHSHGEFALLQAAALAIGVPIPWPLSAPPANHVVMAGQTFSAATYPLLAQVYPSGRLPDMRAVFVRGWDGGRGVDAGRALLSEQLDAMQRITGTAGTFNTNTPQASGAFSLTDSGGNRGARSEDNKYIINFDSGLVARSAAETRPRNVAFNIICRAR